MYSNLTTGKMWRIRFEPALLLTWVRDSFCGHLRRYTSLLPHGEGPFEIQVMMGKQMLSIKVSNKDDAGGNVCDLIEAFMKVSEGGTQEVTYHQWLAWHGSVFSAL